MARLSVVLLFALLLSACNNSIVTELPISTPVVLETETPTQMPLAVPELAFYVDSQQGSDDNPGSLTQPWRTLRKAIRTLPTGSTLYIRGGDYDAAGATYAGDDVSFLNSGTAENPITLTNYPGEQAIIHLNGKNAFSCYWREEKTTVAKTDYIRIIGKDVTPRTLPNGVVSQKGIVIQGEINESRIAIEPFGCDYWEIAGIDFIDVGTAIFAMKYTEGMNVDNSTDHWYVHDNRVYRYWTEQGMQFNGNYNLIENNEIYKVTDVVNRPFGCGMVNFMGNNNILRGNKMSRLGSTADCWGFGFEWNLADANLVEDNYIWDVPGGFGIHGGDGNIIRDNTIIAGVGATGVGAWVESHDNRLDWPCDDRPGTGSPSNVTLPPDNPAHFDYPYYYPWECHSRNNQVINNIMVGFREMIVEVSVADPSNIYSGNMSAPVYGDGLYDDTHEGWIFSDGWMVFTGTGPVDQAVHYSMTAGSHASFTFDGTRFKLIYTGHTSVGLMDIYIDNEKITTINQFSGDWRWQQSWMSDLLTSGRHFIKLVNAGGSLIDIDAIQIFP